jgi:hypothetical protein
VDVVHSSKLLLRSVDNYYDILYRPKLLFNSPVFGVVVEKHSYALRVARSNLKNNLSAGVDHNIGRPYLDIDRIDFSNNNWLDFVAGVISIGKPRLVLSMIQARLHKCIRKLLEEVNQLNE